MKTFLSIDKAPSGQKGGKQPQKNKDGQMQKTLEVARMQGKTMEELLQYDVSSTSPLFDHEGFMTKATKSNIVHELEQHLTKEDSSAPQLQDDKKTGYIVDVMATVHKFGTKNLSNFGSLCDTVLRYIQNVTRGANRIDLVFDSYIEKSMKDSESQRHEKKSPNRTSQHK